MHIYIDFGVFKVPSYGFFITLGVIIANVLATILIKRHKQNINNFIILESYCFLGGFFGAKILYLIINFREIEWRQITEPKYFNEIMQSGFVFYGGLLGGLLFVWLAGRFHKFDVKFYLKEYVFLLPFIHCFGRIGCFMAGCCYGIPYNGIGAVVFPENSLAIPEIHLFPIQLLEAMLLLGIAIILFVIIYKNKSRFTIEVYLIMYGIIRFFIEYLRFDEQRGFIFGLSISQWISLLITISASMSILFQWKHGQY